MLFEMPSLLGNKIDILSSYYFKFNKIYYDYVLNMNIYSQNPFLQKLTEYNFKFGLVKPKA